MQKLSIFPYFYAKNSQKKGRVHWRFQAKRAKYSNFCIIKMTNAIAMKFCTVIKTTKFSLWFVPKFASQIQDGRRPPTLNDIWYDDAS